MRLIVLFSRPVRGARHWPVWVGRWGRPAKCHEGSRHFLVGRRGANPNEPQRRARARRTPPPFFLSPLPSPRFALCTRGTANKWKALQVFCVLQAIQRGTMANKWRSLQVFCILWTKSLPRKNDYLTQTNGARLSLMTERYLPSRNSIKHSMI